MLLTGWVTDRPAAVLFLDNRFLQIDNTVAIFNVTGQLIKRLGFKKILYTFPYNFKIVVDRAGVAVGTFFESNAALGKYIKAVDRRNDFNKCDFFRRSAQPETPGWPFHRYKQLVPYKQLQNFTQKMLGDVLFGSDLV